MESAIASIPSSGNEVSQAACSGGLLTAESTESASSPLLLRVCVSRARSLSSNDKDNTLNSVAIVRCQGQDQSTEVIKKTSAPEWDCTLDFPLSDRKVSRLLLYKRHKHSADTLSVAVYSKDKLKKVPIGQVKFNLAQLFADNASVSFKDAKAKWYPLDAVTRRYFKHQSDTVTEAQVELKWGLVSTTSSNTEVLHEAWKAFLSRLSLIQDVAVDNALSTDLEGVSLEDQAKAQENETQTQAAKERAVAVPPPTMLGLLFLEIVSASDLPPVKRALKVGFDMDPFVIVSYGLSTFRTRSVRHSLNPKWEETLVIPVRSNESSYQLKFSVYDKDTFSNNDHIAWQEVPVAELLEESAIDTKKAVDAGALANGVASDMACRQVALKLTKADKWPNIQSTLCFRVKFVSYSDIRNMFWHALAKSYDADQVGSLSRMEARMMLESIGSTLSEDTLKRIWKENNKDPDNEDETLTVQELSESLERFMIAADVQSGKHGLGSHDDPFDDDDSLSVESDSSSAKSSEDTSVNLVFNGAQALEYDGTAPVDFDDDIQLTGEKVIQLNACPICHRQNLAHMSQMAILTHVATCSAHDWTATDKFLMGNFVTEAYAQRRWFTKLINTIGYGRYKPGKDNANILVQDRRTGQLIEERMSVYVRVGMRLLYKGMKTGIQSSAAQRILTNLTIRQGKRYDAPESIREIEPFIKFHRLDMSEVLDTEFKSFNDFFYRKLKPGSRPCDYPDDPSVVVSPADCRMVAFPTIDDATHLWIKGLEFSIEKLLGSSDEAAYYHGGSLAIFRLAPQDYHRFHSPVDGTIVGMDYIHGQYYTVNPMAIRTTLDVYGENARCIVRMDTQQFGKVAVVCIGAMLVGSIQITPKVGDYLARTDELGYFGFGGSTIVVLWQKDTVTFDADLLENSDRTLETLVRVGNHIAVSNKNTDTQ